MTRWFWLVGAWLLALAVGAQSGGIRGTVMDQDLEVPLPGVKVLISETGQEVASGEAGAYVFENVGPGAYTLLFSKEGYARVTKPGVVVAAGQLAETDAEMAGEYEEMDELVVRDIQLGGSSEIGLLNLRMESVAMLDSVGADLMSRAGAGDAAQALRLVPGTTIQDGKYAVVRGLPDRYVSAQMNGVRLPTADADKRAVQLDQFPSSVIESIQVSKTFTPDQQGDASGGAVNLVLKSIPDEPLLAFSTGVEFNTQVQDAKDRFLSYENGGVDYWGKDGGGRDLPIKAADSVFNGQGGLVPRKQMQTALFDPVMGTKRTDAPELDYKWAATAGNTFALDSGLKVGGLFNFNYSHDTSYYEEGQDRTYNVQPIAGGKIMQPRVKKDVAATKLYDATSASEEVQWGVLGAVGAEFGGQSVKLLFMQTHSAEDSATLLEDTEGYDVWRSKGFPYSDLEYYSREQTLRYTERTTSTLQLSGDHEIPVDAPAGDFFTLLNPGIDWMAAWSDSYLDQPDTRFFSSHWNVDSGFYFGEDPSNVGVAQRLWKEITEESEQFFINGRVPFEQWNSEEGEVKLGVFQDTVEREYTQDSFRYSEHPNFLIDDFSNLWSDVYPSQGGYILNSGSDIYYDGRSQIDAWYWMADVPIWSFVNAVGGVRYEGTDISTKNKIVGGTNQRYIYTRDKLWEFVTPDNIAEKADATLQQDDVLPSIGLVLKPIKDVTLRASYTETVARPTFKELSPIQQVDYSGGDIFVGNPDLQMSSLENQDVRLEWTPYPGGLISGSWFHKDIADPIERVQQFNAGQYFTTVVNYEDGTIDGFEFEIRQQLGELWEPLEGLGIGFNLTQIDSEVTVPDAETSRGAPATRDMLNTPDMLYNINMTYEISRFGTQLGLFYIYTGDKLVEGATYIGTEVPNVYEKEYGTLNFSLSQKIGKSWKLSFAARNLTDPDIQKVYRADGVAGEEIRSSYQRGRDYSIGLSYTW